MKKTLLTLALFGFTVVLHAQVPSYVPSNGLVAWWPFNGDATDQSSNGNDGAVNGASLTTDRNSKGASAYSFDGTNDYINCGNIADLQGATALTLSAWVNIDTKTGSARIISNESALTNDEGARIQLTYNTGNNFAGGVSDTLHGSGGFNCTGTSLASNSWYHVVLVFNGSGATDADRMKVYVNGQPESISYTFSMATLSTNRNTELWIGGIYNNPSLHAFNGKIDDVGLWNRALTPAEVDALYQSPNTSVQEDQLATLPEIKVFPNPSKGVFNLQGDLTNASSYSVYDMNGKLIQIGEIKTEELELNLSTEKKGVYLLRVVTSQGVSNKKLIKQ